MQYRTVLLALALLVACGDADRGARPDSHSKKADAVDAGSDAEAADGGPTTAPDAGAAVDDESPAVMEPPAIPESKHDPVQIEPDPKPDPKPDPTPDSRTEPQPDPEPSLGEAPAAPVLEVESWFSAAIARWNDTGANDYSLRLTAASTDAREFKHVSSPFYISALSNGTPYKVELIAKHVGRAEAHATAYARPSAPLLDGAVRAAAAVGTSTYVGGDFRRISLHTGALTAVDPATGYSSGTIPFPIVDGEVYSVYRLGDNTYVIGGRFSTVAGQPRANLARIRVDGTLDPDWNPGTNGAVRAFTGSHRGIFVGGEFTSIGGQPRTGFAEVDLSGAVTEWDAQLDGSVTAIAPVAGTALTDDLALAGSFRNVGTRPCARLAVLSSRGPLKSGWTCPNPNGDVKALTVSRYREYYTLYVGGEFTSIGGTPQKYFAVVNSNGTPTAEHVRLDGPVVSIVADLDPRAPAPDALTLYVAGDFTVVNGAPRPGVAALDGFWTVLAWNPLPEPGGSILGMKLFGRAMYLNGFFERMGGVERRGAAAVSVESDATPTRWNPNLNGPVYWTSFDYEQGFSVILGGAFTGAGGVRRERLAAFLDNGELAGWNPGADARVSVIAAAGGTLYVGGSFGRLGVLPRAHLGAIDTSGRVTHWDPQADAPVSALATWGTTVYAGGSFENIAGVARAHLAALDASGQPTAWDPRANGDVRALLTDGPTVYVAGEFTQLGAAARERLAALDAATGEATAWNPGADGAVNALTFAGGSVIAGGAFANIGGAARAHLAALDAVSGAATSWAPVPDAPVHALAIRDEVLYVGGEFSSASDASRTRLAAYDATFGLLDYAPSVDGTVSALVVGQSVSAGGEFTTAFTQLRPAR